MLNSKQKIYTSGKMQLKPSVLITLIFVLYQVRHITMLELLQNLVPPAVLDALRMNKNAAAFIKLLGIPNTGLVHPYPENQEVIPMFNPDLHFGDLLLDEPKEEPKTGGRSVAEADKEVDGKEDEDDEVMHDFRSGGRRRPRKCKGKKIRKIKWVNGVIPYHISSDYTGEQKETIESYIKSLNSRLSEVQFRPFDSWSHSNYLYIFNGKGCYSRLGMNGGQQPMSLQANICLKKGIVQHELMHATGFSHEQNRPDRDQYVTMLTENIPKQWEADYRRKNPSEAAYVGSYDYYSAMHYPMQAPGGSRKRAFIILDDSVDPEDVGNKDELSDLDIEKINKYYTVPE